MEILSALTLTFIQVLAAMLQLVVNV